MARCGRLFKDSVCTDLERILTGRLFRASMLDWRSCLPWRTLTCRRWCSCCKWRHDTRLGLSLSTGPCRVSSMFSVLNETIWISLKVRCLWCINMEILLLVLKANVFLCKNTNNKQKKEKKLRSFQSSTVQRLNFSKSPYIKLLINTLVNKINTLFNNQDIPGSNVCTSKCLLHHHYYY